MFIFKKKEKHSKSYNKVELQKNIYFEGLLKELEDTGDTNVIPKLYRVVLLRDNIIKVKIIKEIHKIIRELEPREYYYLDVIFRRNIYDQYNIEPKRNITIKDLEIDGLSEEENITLIGLATFNHDGWLRQEALLKLIKYNNKEIIPFVIMRTVDWVDYIKETAVTKLKEIISGENFSDILFNISLVKRMEKFLRFDCEMINRLIEDIYNQNNLEQQLKDGLRIDDNYVREYSLLNLIKYYQFNIYEIVEFILKEKIPSIRVKAIEKLLENITEEELLKYKDKLLIDKNYKVKSRVLYKLYSYGYFKTAEVLIPYALDKNRTIREDARYYIKKLGSYDFINLYKNNLTLRGGILGLCDVATDKEIGILKELLYVSTGRVAKKIINTMAFINIYSCEKEVIKLLSGNSIKLSNNARSLLVKNKGVYDYEEIYKLYKGSLYEHVATNSIIILCNGSKWNSLPYILEFCASEIKEYSDIGKSALCEWCYKFNKSLVKPTSKQIESIESAIEEYKLALSDEKIRELKFLLI